jgi:hypothetical protein
MNNQLYRWFARFAKKSSHTFQAKPLRFEAMEPRAMFAVMGDSNLDGVFDSTDLVKVFQDGRSRNGWSATLTVTGRMTL